MQCIEIEVLDHAQLAAEMLPALSLDCAAAEREVVQIALDLANRSVDEGRAAGRFKGVELEASFTHVGEQSFVMLKVHDAGRLRVCVRTHYVRLALPLAWCRS
jgi:hypothetical protein